MDQKTCSEYKGHLTKSDFAVVYFFIRKYSILITWIKQHKKCHNFCEVHSEKKESEEETVCRQ